MRLNPDCVRDVLLAVEDGTDFVKALEYSADGDVPKFLRRYDHAEVIYHIRQCDRAGLILGVRYYEDGDYIEVDDLAPAGHQFLANVRQDTIWNHTKEIAAKVGSKSLDALLQISSGVVTELIRSQLGLI